MVYVWTASRTLTLYGEMRLAYEVSGLVAGDVCIVGGCIGGDALIAELAWQIDGVHIHCVLPADHSRVDPHWREHCHSFEQMPDGTDYRARDQRMVDIGLLKHGVLKVCPSWPESHPAAKRSGTWLTKRLAVRAGLPFELVPLWEEDGEGRNRAVSQRGARPVPYGVE